MMSYDILRRVKGLKHFKYRSGSRQLDYKWLTVYTWVCRFELTDRRASYRWVKPAPAVH